jgi:hypothetical protein
VRLLLAAGAVAASVLASPSAISPPDLVRAALEGLACEPSARIEDAYKWLFQGARGGEHAAPSEEAARSYLLAEWEALGPPLPGEPLLVPLRPDGAVVRLNLRPFRAAGGGLEPLLLAFLRSARLFQQEPGLFLAAWQALGLELDQRPRGALTRAEWTRLDESARAAGYPAAHHGRDYAASCQPSYRVLDGETARELERTLGGTSP